MRSDTHLRKDSTIKATTLPAEPVGTQRLRLNVHANACDPRRHRLVVPARGFTLLEVVAALALLGGLVAAASAAGGRLDRRALQEERRAAAVDALDGLLARAQLGAATTPRTPGLRPPDLGRRVALALRDGSGGFEGEPGLRWTATLRPLGLAGTPGRTPPGDAAFEGLGALEVAVEDAGTGARAAVFLVVGPERRAPAPEAPGSETPDAGEPGGGNGV